MSESPLDFAPATQGELDQNFAKKYDIEGTGAGPGPKQRRAYGYFHPAEHYEAIVERFVTPETRWLDVGAGEAPFPHNHVLSRELANRCQSLTGVDPSVNVLRNPFAHHHFHGLLEDFGSDEVYDLITLRMVAEHVSDPHQLVHEIRKRIAPSGIVVILTVWAYSPVTILSRLLPNSVHYPIKRMFWGGDEKDTFPTVYRMNSKQTLRELFGGVGFNCKTLYLCSDCSVTSQFMSLNRIELWLAKLCRRINLPYPESCLIGVFQFSSGSIAHKDEF